MNNIKKYPIQDLGYHFIPKEFLPEGKDEYYLRFEQNSATDYRKLTKAETTILISNGNRSDNWNNILVREGIDIHLIEECTFFGLVRIGKLEPYFLEFNEVRFAVGLYKSVIVSCDIGNNAAIHNVKFLSHYIICDEVILNEINEMSCTSHAKFGNGIIKEGENEAVRIWLEICNENGGRKVLPFDGMLAGDAWLWSKYRNDAALMQKLIAFTEHKFNNVRGYYGTVGKRTVIKSTHSIKDVKIGSDAYIKGANKLKNLTINSAKNAKSQIGEGCEMVNGIVGYGSRSFYGVKAVRFILAPFSQLKYGARLINSYLGENATISCCEVLNSLIFPAHEQHHNNSFLCAALLMGQSNMAAGATIGSNHNSRGADGELQAGRGFWPGLCVSLKHNSKFASFTMIAKGDFPAELNIPLPFSLISNEVSTDCLVVMPAYWLLYNMYAIVRNERKFAIRDKRNEKLQYIEYDFLAPDSVNEILEAIRLLQLFTGKAFYTSEGLIGNNNDFIEKGMALLNHEPDVINRLEILADGFENSKRKVKLIKVQRAYNTYKNMVIYYGATQMFHFMKDNNITSLNELVSSLTISHNRQQWINVGGQLIEKQTLQTLIDDIKNNTITSWDAVHQFYQTETDTYKEKKRHHAITAALEVLNIHPQHLQVHEVKQMLLDALETKQKIFDVIVSGKLKDHENEFRKMAYDNSLEMEQVIGSFNNNEFIKEQQQELQQFRLEVTNICNLAS